MRRPHDPTRRNRNIGTAKQGHGADNANTIPDNWFDFRAYWEKMPGCRSVSRDVHGQELALFIQPVDAPCVHACTPDDVAQVLSLLPAADVDGIGAILFRQPTRRQRTLCSVWGRLGYFVQVGPHDGPAIILESWPLAEAIRWGRRLSPEWKKELDRIETDGHPIEATKREFIIRPTDQSLRNGILYRTLLHEVGHWVDWKATTGLTAATLYDADLDGAEWSLWDRKPHEEREAAAHRYAEETAARLRAEGKIPFEPIGLDPDAMRAEGLEREWFASPDS